MEYMRHGDSVFRNSDMISFKICLLVDWKHVLCNIRTFLHSTGIYIPDEAIDWLRSTESQWTDYATQQLD